MPGMEKLKSYLPDSIVIATADLCHHGIAYSMHPDQVIPISKRAEQFAIDSIEKGLSFFSGHKYAEYFDYSYSILSDGVDIGQVLMYLKGPLKTQLLDLRLIDTSHLFEGEPSPSWVAIALIEMTPI